MARIRVSSGNSRSANCFCLACRFFGKRRFIRGTWRLALRLGAADYIVGPHSDEVLLARIRSRLSTKALIDSLESSIAEWTETEELRRRLFRMASHDLKSPLNNIRIAESILRLAVADSSEVAHSLDMIRLMVDNMSDIISNFLDMMEVQTGKLELTIKPVNLRDVLTNVANQYRFAAMKKNIRLGTWHDGRLGARRSAALGTGFGKPGQQCYQIQLI